MMIFSTICLALIAVTVKSLHHFSLMEIIFFRNLLIVLIIPLILKSKKIPFWGNNRSVLLLRSLFGTFGMVAYFYTIGFMPLTDAVTIQLLSPFFIIIFAEIFLREKIVPKQIYIFICAFIGVLLIIFNHICISSIISNNSISVNSVDNFVIYCFF